MKITVICPTWQQTDGVIFDISEKDFNRILTDLIIASGKPSIEKLKDDLPSKHCGRMRYVKRFTQDLVVCQESNSLDELKQGKSDYLLHILDRETDLIVWQNGKSVRYGDVGVGK